MFFSYIVIIVHLFHMRLNPQSMRYNWVIIMIHLYQLKISYRSWNFPNMLFSFSCFLVPHTFIVKLIYIMIILFINIHLFTFYSLLFSLFALYNIYNISQKTYNSSSLLKQPIVQNKRKKH